MSWGERSCKQPCRCPDKCEMYTCNVNCPEYIWDGVTEPDSKPIRKKKSKEPEKQNPTRKGLNSAGKNYKNYSHNQQLRRDNPNIRKIKNGVPVSYWED